MTAEPIKTECAVIGAGAVGLACALALQGDGREVVVIDRGRPGEAASFGNAGHIATEEIRPLASVETIKAAIGYLRRKDMPLSFRASYLPTLAPWIARFLWASRPAAFRRGVAAMQSLCEPALKEHQILAQRTGAGDLLHAAGSFSMFETDAGGAAAEADVAFLNDHGVPAEMLDERSARAACSGLPGQAAGAARFAGAGHVEDPDEMCRRWALAFKEQGGRFMQGDVAEIRRSRDGYVIRTRERHIVAERVVVAAGVWSKPLAKMLHVSAPLDTERGYHISAPEQGRARLSAPVASIERRIILTSQRPGLRITGFVEFGGLKAGPDPRKYEILKGHYRELICPLREGEVSTWMGFRPTLPDFLPVIGRLDGRPDAYFAFGHHHLGVTLSAVTGRIIADLAAGRDPGVDLTPFAPDRF